MEKRHIILIITLLIILANLSEAQVANKWSVDLARSLSKDIFELNGIPFLKPMVEAVNATSNARFFNQAYIPSEVDNLYFRVGVHGMFGFIRDDMKTYTPHFPTDSFDIAKLQKYGKLEYINNVPTVVISDTAGLINYLFKTVLYNGVKKGSLNPPDKASTVLGNMYQKILLNQDTLKNLTKEHPLYPFLPKNIQDSVLNAIGGLPSFFSFPAGGNLNSIFAFIPQVEIGSLYGTELLIRFIPPVRLGNEIGDFSFWGIGLKHSISQYFNKRIFDLAVQAVYQGTYLKNTIGVTNSELKSNATMLNFNINASKSFEDIVDIFTGLSFEYIKIGADFKYYLPIEMQAQLNLVQNVVDSNDISHYLPPDPEHGYPGDTQPQTSSITISDYNFKWVLGLSRQVGPIAVFIDYSLSKFNIFSAGIEARF